MTAPIPELPRKPGAASPRLGLIACGDARRGRRVRGGIRDRRYQAQWNGGDRSRLRRHRRVGAPLGALRARGSRGVHAESNPQRLPDLTFLDADGKPVKLSDFRGRMVLLNLWATWCVPCRKEMPALDELAARGWADKFAVLAINLDTGDRQKPKQLPQRDRRQQSRLLRGPDHERVSGAEASRPRARTAHVDPRRRDGCELGSLAGPAEWASGRARAGAGGARRMTGENGWQQRAVADI